MRWWNRHQPAVLKPAHYCPVCDKAVDSFKPGPGGRPNARCPHCHSLERHRYLAVLLGAFSREVSASRYMLEVAPTPSVTRLLRSGGEGRYVGIDIDPLADGRAVQVVADLCAAPFADGAFDTSVCFHVFEHIPDDLAAMGEYARIISPTGIGFVQNPWREKGPTQEDPSASPEERIMRFGQADHVRIYGQDFEDRLRSVGLDPRRVLPEHVVQEPAITTMGIRRGLPIWIVFGPRSPLAVQPNEDFIIGTRTQVEEYLSRFTQRFSIVR